MLNSKGIPNRMGKMPDFGAALASDTRQSYAEIGANVAPPLTWEKRMTWKTPKIVEVPVGMEINMYACAARK
jgi:coenzyme PQQ precursor peptide PqqA